jgi:cytochrome c oxidase subunit 2
MVIGHLPRNWHPQTRAGAARVAAKPVREYVVPPDSIRRAARIAFASVGGTATVIAILYLVLVVLGVGISIAVWRSTRRRKQVDQKKLERRERGWMVVVVVLLVALLFGTIFFIPYNESIGADGQVVTVEARQFAWEIRPDTIVAGRPVEFQTTAIDVNHGFGVYDDDYTFLFQIQVIPGRTSNVVYTFDDPGTYQVLCMEFCGFAHHLMITTFEVVAP